MSDEETLKITEYIKIGDGPVADTRSCKGGGQTPPSPPPPPPIISK